MNLTPRGLNRTLVAIFGLILFLGGILLVLIATVHPVAHVWRGIMTNVAEWIHAAFRSMPLGNHSSWLWVILIVAVVLVGLLSLGWLAQQGRGRVSLILEHDDDAAVQGDVTISAHVAEQLLRQALGSRPDVLGVNVGAYQYRGVTSLRVRVFPRKGVPPQALARDVEEVVDALSALLGTPVPALIHISTGTRALFTREERVR